MQCFFCATAGALTVSMHSVHQGTFQRTHLHSICIVENRFRALFVFDNCTQQHHRCRHAELPKCLKSKHKRHAVAILQMLLIRKTTFTLRKKTR